MRVVAVTLLTGSSLFAQVQPTPRQNQPILPVSVSPQSTTIVIPRNGVSQIYPGAPSEPGKLPAIVAPPVTAKPMVAIPPGQGPSEQPNRPQTTIQLPFPENKIKLEGGAVMIRRQGESCQLWSGTTYLKDLGRDRTESDEIVRIMRELRPTEWVYIGKKSSVVEYGLTNSEAFAPTHPPKNSQPIDLKTVRAEGIRGAWVLRDDHSILLNFGSSREDAQQAAAVVQRYGFNRIGSVGQGFQVFYAQLGQQPNDGPNPLAATHVADQERNLSRTGIEVPGVGFIGERIVMNPSKVEYRKERGEWLVVHGSDVIARFGASEWSARDAVRLIQDMRFTEYCKFNDEISFFLVNGQAPTRVPFSVQASRYDVDGLKVRPASAGAFGVYDSNGRQVFSVPTETDAKNLVKLLQHYRFDQTCQMGLSSRACLKFLAKGGR